VINCAVFGPLSDNTSELRRSTTIVYRTDRQALSTARFCLLSHGSVGSGLVVQVVSGLLRGNWQHFNRHDASRGTWAIVELLVDFGAIYIVCLFISYATPLSFFLHFSLEKEGFKPGMKE